MTTAVFDTLKASDALKAAGIEAKQAEAIVHTMAGAFEDTVATKADMDKLESSVKTDMANLKAELKAEITEVRSDFKQDIASVKGDIKLLKWMIGIVLACVAFPILKSFLQSF